MCVFGVSMEIPSSLPISRFPSVPPRSPYVCANAGWGARLLLRDRIDVKRQLHRRANEREFWKKVATRTLVLVTEARKVGAQKPRIGTVTRSFFEFARPARPRGPR